MKKSWGLTQKILSGEKIIESRWYDLRCAPWGKIHPNDVVYFKDSGEPVTIKTIVDRVEEFDNLNPAKVEQILNANGVADGIGINNLPKFIERFKNKKYCMLIHLKNPERVKPFNIDKTGYGMMAAWLCVDNVNNIKK